MTPSFFCLDLDSLSRPPLLSLTHLLRRPDLPPRQKDDVPSPSFATNSGLEINRLFFSFLCHCLLSANNTGRARSRLLCAPPWESSETSLGCSEPLLLSNLRQISSLVPIGAILPWEIIPCFVAPGHCHHPRSPDSLLRSPHLQMNPMPLLPFSRTWHAHGVSGYRTLFWYLLRLDPFPGVSGSRTMSLTSPDNLYPLLASLEFGLFPAVSRMN